jgi:ribosomal protein L16 Arg81 hydroxylase
MADATPLPNRATNHLPTPGQAPIAPDPARQDFAWAIAPLDPQDFLSDYYEHRHLVIHRADPDYYRDLLALDDIDRVLSTQVLPVEEMQLVARGRPAPAEDYALENGLVDPVRATQLFQQGHTMVLPGLHRRLPALAAFCRALETVFTCDLQTNIYLTPADAQGFKTHYDSHDVIVLQTHGTKTWRIYDSPLALPLRSQAFDPATFTPGALVETFVLQPGDMAYIPRGVVHDAIATDQVSLHITTGLLATRWIDLILESLGAEALRDPDLRRSLPPGFAHGTDRAALVDQARDLMLRAAGAADPGPMLDRFAEVYRRRRLPVVPGQFTQAAAVADLAPGRIAGVRPDLLWTLSAGPDATVTLQVYDGELTFPAAVEPSLRAALTCPRFAVGALPGGLDGAGQVVLVRRLVREGVLQLLD